MLLSPYNNPTLFKETIIVHNCVLTCPINSIISFNEMFILFNTFSLVSGLFIILVVILVLENIAPSGLTAQVFSLFKYWK